jgi:hypothetical protein
MEPIADLVGIGTAVPAVAVAAGNGRFLKLYREKAICHFVVLS